MDKKKPNTLYAFLCLAALPVLAVMILWPTGSDSLRLIFAGGFVLAAYFGVHFLWRSIKDYEDDRWETRQRASRETPESYAREQLNRELQLLIEGGPDLIAFKRSEQAAIAVYTKGTDNPTENMVVWTPGGFVPMDFAINDWYEHFDPRYLKPSSDYRDGTKRTYADRLIKLCMHHGWCTVRMDRNGRRNSAIAWSTNGREEYSRWVHVQEMREFLAYMKEREG